MPNGYQGPETHNEEMLERQLSLANNHVRELRAELERVKAERDDYRDTSAAKEHAYRDAEARLNKALSALREIASYNSDELREWKEENAADMCDRARAAIAEIEGQK